MLVSLTVGKVDAGVAVLLTEDKRLIEFPSILLPPDISSGSIVEINVARNFETEQKVSAHFSDLQDLIFTTFGQQSPSAPVLRCRNATQTSVVLEWDPVTLATAELRSLSLYRNGSKAGNIPRDKLSTKISGLAIDTEYTFHLVLRTSAGTYTSEKLTLKTQKMTDLTGITITPGVMPADMREELAATVERIGAKLIDTVRIDTTHFVCAEGKGQAWEKALEMNVPVVVPDWLKGCEREGRIVGVRGYYLNADPKLRQAGPAGTVNQSQNSISSQQQQGPSDRRPASLAQQHPSQQLRVHPPLSSPRIEHTPPTPEQIHPDPSRLNGADEPPTPPPKQKSSESTSEAPVSAETNQTPEDDDAADSTTQNNDQEGEAARKPADNSAVSNLRKTRVHTPEISPRTPAPAKFENHFQTAEGNTLKDIGIPHHNKPDDNDSEDGDNQGEEEVHDEDEGRAAEEVAVDKTAAANDDDEASKPADKGKDTANKAEANEDENGFDEVSL